MSQPAEYLHSCAVCHCYLATTPQTTMATPDLKRPMGIIVAEGHLRQTIYAIAPQQQSFDPAFVGIPHTRVCSFPCLQRYAQRAERDRQYRLRLDALEAEMKTRPLFVTTTSWELVTAVKISARRIAYRARAMWRAFSAEVK